MTIDPSIINRLQFAQPVTAMQQGMAYADQRRTAEQQNKLRDLQMEKAKIDIASASKPKPWDATQIKLMHGVAKSMLDEAKKNPQAWPEIVARGKAALDAAGVDTSRFGDPANWKPEGIAMFTAQIEKSGALPYQIVPTQQGYKRFNRQTGAIEDVPGSGSEPLLPPTQAPSLQGELSKSKKVGTKLGDVQGENITNLQDYISEGEYATQLVDDLLKHPGLKAAVGMSSVANPLALPGSDRKDFLVRLDQLKGKQFLQAFRSLKGGGPITDIEGKKATDAIARMNTAASEEEFIKAAREFQAIIRKGMERARRAARGDFMSQGEQDSPKGGQHRGSYSHLWGGE